MHAGVVCDLPGGALKLTGTGSTCAPTFQLPALCYGAQEFHISGGCGWSSASLLMLGKCQPRNRPGPASPEPGSGAQRDSDMIMDGGYDTCRQ